MDYLIADADQHTDRWDDRPHVVSEGIIIVSFFPTLNSAGNEAL
jgi:hypothetical protein